MTDGAERQRKRRERLRKQGIVDVTVSVPESRKEILRAFASRLFNGETPLGEGRRLLDVIGALKLIRGDLQSSGVTHAGVFGSTARGLDKAESDVDIVIDIDTDQLGDVLDLIGVAGRIEESIQTRCPGVKVDVADHAMLKRRTREEVEKEAVYAF